MWTLSFPFWYLRRVPSHISSPKNHTLRPTPTRITRRIWVTYNGKWSKEEKNVIIFLWPHLLRQVTTVYCFRGYRGMCMVFYFEWNGMEFRGDAMMVDLIFGVYYKNRLTEKRLQLCLICKRRMYDTF